MARHKELPPLDLLLSRFTYDCKSGELLWRITSTNGKRKPGDIVGKKNSYGCIDVKIDGTWYKAHRIIWKMVTGEDPGNFVIDHKDGNPANNKFSNLRLATIELNSANSRLQANKKSGLPKGVVQYGNRFYSRIGGNKCRQYIGSFDNPESASAAYIKRAREIWGPFANGGSR